MSKNIKDSPFSLIKKISDNTYLTWVKELNKYIVLDSKILTLIVRKKLLSNSDFLNEISKTLDVSIDIAKTISNEINELELNLNQSSSITQKQSSQILLDCPNDYFYSFNNVTIKVSFDSEDTRRLVDPKFSHLQINNTDSFRFHYSVFIHNELIYLFKNNEIVDAWNKNEMHEFLGKFSMEFLCSSYNNSEHDWMGVFHASTILKNNKSIMFTGDSGNGKSTLVTILMANGYNIIADDFTPILRSDLKTYCFPMAISIKEKSFDLIELLHPQIKDLDQYYIDEIKGHVKYLPPVTDKISANCNSVVWVKYGKDSDNNLEKISTENALQKFLPDAWISNQEVNAKAFMKWVAHTNFYELKYSDNKKLISLVDSLFLD